MGTSQAVLGISECERHSSRRIDPGSQARHSTGLRADPKQRCRSEQVLYDQLAGKLPEILGSEAPSIGDSAARCYS